MRIYVLFAQSRESYTGECAPEALAAVDEFAMDENPEGLMAGILEEFRVKRGKNVVAIGWVSMDVDAAAVRARLIPSERPIKAVLVP